MKSKQIKTRILCLSHMDRVFYYILFINAMLFASFEQLPVMPGPPATLHK